MAGQADDLDVLEIAIAGEIAAADRRIITSWGLPVPTDFDYHWGEFGTDHDIQIACELFASSIAIIFLSTVPPHLLLLPPPLNKLGLAPTIEFGKPGAENHLGFFMPTSHIKPRRNLERYYHTMLRFKQVYELARQLLISDMGKSQSVQIRRAIDLLINKRPLSVAERGLQFAIAQEAMTREMVRYALQDDDDSEAASASLQSPALLEIDKDIVDQINESISTDAAATPSDRYVFRKEGENWTVRYGKSENQSFPDLHGMAYIHYLLTQPHQPIRADRLYHAIHGIPGDVSKNLAASELMPEDDEDVPTVIDIVTPVDDDEETVSQYRGWLKRIDEEEARARRNEDPIELAEIQHRKTELIKLIGSEFGLHGTRRSLADPYKRPRQAVSKAIRVAIERIRHVNRPFAEHLDDSIATGSQCRYSPQSDINWIF
ncbi:MAG: hypothetical protein ACYDCO_24020 [Armatimonadota bacterium]